MKVGSRTLYRILYVAYPLLPVSEESCGGAEQMLAVLERELARRGHDTTVAACSGSRPQGELFATGREVVEPDRLEERDAEHSALILKLLQDSGDSFDLVHDESGSFWQHAAEIDGPVLATLHLPRSFYPEEAFQDLPHNLFFNCVSESQAKTFTDVPHVVGAVPNGIPVERFPFTPEKQDYLLWMGRICEEKAPHLAIQVAEKCGLPLVLVGQVYPFSYHQQYYIREIRPRLGNVSPKVCFVETPTLETKTRLVRNARALLVPSMVDETSSLVSMEAMACGTPVIAFRRGAIPEVVIDGVTGFLTDSVEGMVGAVEAVSNIKPRACRKHVESSHSASEMAAQYETLYRRVLDQYVQEKLGHTC